MHSLAWLVWAVSVAGCVLVIRNPLYVSVIGLAVWLVHSMVRDRHPLSKSLEGLVKIGAMIWLVTIPFNALMIHEGTHVLMRLPASWPLIGGKITWEAILYGVAAGLNVWVLILVFTTFNMAVDSAQLLRLVPAFVAQAGMITSIALTFLPQMLASAKEIRDAQRLRGHRFRSWRDLIPLFMPLLTTALEQAIQLAESMESRGFGGQVSDRGSSASQFYGRIIRGLVLLLSGLFLYGYWSLSSWVGISLILVASIILLDTFRMMGKMVQRSHYRRAQWRRRDVWLIGISASLVAITLFIRAIDPLALVFYPYAQGALAPEFNAWIGLALTLVAWPGLSMLISLPASNGPIAITRSQERS